MGIAGSPDIFQAKMSKLMVALEFIRTYLDDLLCITKASLDDHLNHLRLVNAKKSKFCAEETKYLGYILTRTGISHTLQKYRQYLQSHRQKQSKTSVSSWAWSRTLWARCSKTLAPLTSLVGECGHTKITRAQKTKKKASHWVEVHQIALTM